MVLEPQTMDGTFNGQILAEKLAKLNSSQQSIETLSHWCIFHRKKARQVVEIWDRQFHCSPREQRVSFLYLANDILQNSRRKGFEFVGEFWNVLPDALSDVFKNGDEFGRTAVSRLVAIWADRKVFGSRGQRLKEEILGSTADNKDGNGNITNYKLKKPRGDFLEKLFSSYEHVHDGHVDEDTLVQRCQTAISDAEKAEKEIRSDNLGKGSHSRPGAEEELQGQYSILRECIEQLITAESSRITLQSLLSEALREQESKIKQIRSQLGAAKSHYEQVGNILQQLHRPKETLSVFSDASPSFTTDHQGSSGDREAATPMNYIQQVPFADNSLQTQEECRKTAAAAMAAKLTSSATSAQMLSYVLSSLASEGVIGQSAKEDYPSDLKRPKLENDAAPYIPSHTQPPPPPYPHPDTIHQPPPPPPQQSSPMRRPSPTLQPPPRLMPATQLMSPPPSQYMQTAGPMTSVPYIYGSTMPPLAPLPFGYPMLGMPPHFAPPNPYHILQASEGGLFNHAPPPTPPPSITRQ